MLDVAPNKRPVNMVFQHLALFPMMNVADNIGYGLRRAGLPKRDITRKVGEVLERIGLPEIGRRRVDELRAGKNSAWRSRAAWFSNRTCCFLMNRSARST